jgi:hypothetical protein
MIESIRKFFREGEEVPPGFITFLMIMVITWVVTFVVGFVVAWTIYA